MAIIFKSIGSEDNLENFQKNSSFPREAVPYNGWQGMMNAVEEEILVMG